MLEVRDWTWGVLVLLVGCGDPPSHPPAVKLQKLIRQNRSVEALQLCDELLAIEPFNEFVLLKRGQAHLSLHNPDAAREDFERVLQANPANRDAIYYLTKTTSKTTGIGSAVASPTLKQRPPTELTAQAQEVPTYEDGGSPNDELPRRSITASAQPSVQTNTVMDQLRRDIHRARRQELEAQLQAELAAQLTSRADWKPMPLDESLPRQIVRADFGLGLPVVDRMIVPIATTGGPTSRVLDEAQPDARFGIVGQDIPAPIFGSRPSARFQMDAFCAPFEDRTRPPYRAQCEDGRDNNANLLVDRFDPECWENPLDPATYSPKLDEGIGTPMEAPPPAVAP